MKLKTIRKKISRLEARLKEAPARLVRLKQKLEAAVKANDEKAERKLVARVSATREASASRPARKRTRPRTMKVLATTPAPPKAPSAAKPKTPSAPKKVKRKLNLSPERRAQLAEAMKARWTAKRAKVPESAPPPPPAGDLSINPSFEAS